MVLFPLPNKNRWFLGGPQIDDLRYLLIFLIYSFLKMPSCELCGKEAPLVVADVEGVELKVCAGCGKLGKVKRQITLPKPKRIVPQAEVPEFRVVDNFSSLLRSVREKKKMNQEEFAHFLNEKESIIPKWESGQLKPDIETAQKIGKKLGINLVEKEEIMLVKTESTKTGDVTLGDLVKIKNRK